MDSPQNFLEVVELYDIEEQLHAEKQLNLKLLQEIKVVLKKEKFLRNCIKSYVHFRESLAAEISNLNRQLSLEYLNVKNRKMEHDLVVKRYKNWDSVFCKIIEIKIRTDKLKIKSIKNEINKIIMQSGIQMIEILKQSDKDDFNLNNSQIITEESGFILSERTRWKIHSINGVEAEDKGEEKLKSCEGEIDYGDNKKSLVVHVSGNGETILPKKHHLGIDIPVLKIPIKFGETGNEKFCRDILKLKKPVIIHIPPGIKLFESSSLTLNEPFSKRKLCCVNKSNKNSDNPKKKGNFSFGSVSLSKFELKHLKKNAIKDNDTVFLPENISSRNKNHLAWKSELKKISMNKSVDTSLNKTHLEHIKLRRSSYTDAISNITIDQESPYSISSSSSQLTKPCTRLLSLNCRNSDHDNEKGNKVCTPIENYTIQSRFYRDEHSLCQKSFTNQKYYFDRPDEFVCIDEYWNKIKKLYYDTSFDKGETSSQKTKSIGCKTTPVLSSQKIGYTSFQKNFHQFSKIVQNISSADLEASKSHCEITGGKTSEYVSTNCMNRTNGSVVNRNDIAGTLNNSVDNGRSLSSEKCVVEVSIRKENFTNFIGSKKAAERVTAGFRKTSSYSDLQLHDNAYCFDILCCNGFIPDNLDFCTKKCSPEKDFSMSSIEGTWRKRNNEEFNFEFSCVNLKN